MKVQEFIQRRETERKCEEEALAILRKNAVECTYYMAFGRVQARELSEKYGIDQKVVEGLLAKAATQLVDQINAKAFHDEAGTVYRNV